MGSKFFRTACWFTTIGISVLAIVAAPSAYAVGPHGLARIAQHHAASAVHHSSWGLSTLIHAIIYGFGRHLGSSAAGALIHVFGAFTVLAAVVVVVWLMRRRRRARSHAPVTTERIN